MNMRPVSVDDLKDLYIPPPDSHKGQNGKLLIIGGSHLFHAASLWALTVASRIVDLVHYSSVPENNAIVQKAKEEFRNGIVVSRKDIPDYIKEDDVVLVGPGMDRSSETKDYVNKLFRVYGRMRWVIDAGALQMMDVNFMPARAIITPHRQEFESLWDRFEISDTAHEISAEDYARTLSLEEKVKIFAKVRHCTVLVKGKKDIACNGGVCDEKYCVPDECRVVEGGNSGMTKGGTGDVLAGLIAALACKNDPFLATIAGSFINKKAGDALYEKVGPYFNASDLANQIPLIMKRLLF
ncbi:NAD(P)H-hydrate dehydratase [Candidatus Gottesmanbacteria bacterium]|nr:NAD(P)H-hydrate dehydratase [Candidatus Gottesmanbacteria bacterium]